MSKLTVVTCLTLDGVMENPAWTAPYFNEEVAQHQRELLFAADALLLGRVTYEGFAAAWPSMQDEDGFADRMNRLPKFVASTTLPSAEWNATVLAGNVAEAVAGLKQPGQHLLLYGSAELVRSLLPHGLIDEFHLLVHPLVLGRGKKLFAAEHEAGFRLVESSVTSTSVLLLTYRPVLG